MKNYYLKRIICALLLIACSFSCSSDLDFDQANDLKVEPVVVGNLSYFDIPAANFVAIDGTQKNFVFNSQEFDVFRDKNFSDDLQKASFYFEINNTINRAYGFDIRLLNESNQVIYTIHFEIPAYSGLENITKRTVTFEGTDLDLLKSSRHMEFVLNMTPGPALNQNSTGNLILRSSATLYLAIE